LALCSDESFPDGQAQPAGLMGARFGTRRTGSLPVGLNDESAFPCGYDEPSSEGTPWITILRDQPQHPHNQPAVIATWAEPLWRLAGKGAVGREASIQLDLEAGLFIDTVYHFFARIGQRHAAQVHAWGIKRSPRALGCFRHGLFKISI